MSFKNLETRFNETVDKLYGAAKYKFDDGKPALGKTDQPYIVRTPGQSQKGIRLESRSLPTVSTSVDTKRITLFQISKGGLAFLAKQQLLQTGNTFEQTRVINPLFVLSNTVPFVHIRRHLLPSNGLIGKTDTSENNVRKMGQLQQETYDKLSNSVNINSLLKKIPLIGKTITAATAKKNIRDLGWKKSRPELVSKPIKKIDSQIDQIQRNKISTPEPYLKYFTAGNKASIVNGSQSRNGTINAVDLANANRPKKGNISYIKDPANILKKVSGKIQPEYADLSRVGSFDDPITVSFAMGADDHIQFRAFIKDLQQTSTPTYKDYQYIGRIEKFISYVTSQRQITFKLGILAFSEDELNGVWKKINYLTGLTFPYGINSGILQPNIVRLTIGNVYVNQPGYILGLNTSFNELSETWDIDRDVPISAMLSIQMALIEKKTKLANTPFYGITERLDSKNPSVYIPELKNNLSSNNSTNKINVEKILPKPIMNSTSPASKIFNTLPKNFLKGIGG